MAVSNKYARRRRNAVLAAIVMALIIVIIVVIIISAASSRGKDPSSVTPTPSPTFPTILLPTVPPATDATPDGTPDGTVDGTLDGTLVSPTPTPTPDPNAGIVMFVTGETVNVRENADATSNKITALAKGTSVTAYEQTNGFYEVKLSDGKKGYISAKYLSEEDPKSFTPTPIPSPTATPDTSKGTKMFVIGDGVNVRKSNTTSADKVAQLVKGKEVTAYAKVGDWTYIQYGTNKYGYISTKFLSDKAPATATPAPTLTIKPSATATAKPTATTAPTPTAKPARTSFSEIGVAEKVALVVNGNTEYLKKASAIKGMNLGNEDGSNPEYINYYKIGSNDGSGDFYIVFKGTSSAPTWADIQTTQPTNAN